jgi:hypothetical protein
MADRFPFDLPRGLDAAEFEHHPLTELLVQVAREGEVPSGEELLRMFGPIGGARQAVEDAAREAAALHGEGKQAEAIALAEQRSAQTIERSITDPRGPLEWKRPDPSLDQPLTPEELAGLVPPPY